MVRKWIICVVLIFSGLVRAQEELGAQIYKAIEANDLEAIKGLIVTTEDIIATLDHFDMDTNRREKVKRSLVEKVEQDMPLTIATIEKGFKNIQAVFSSKKCKKGHSMGNISQNINVVNGLPFEIGALEIEIVCGKHLEKMTVEIIHTETGWYILEKLRLLPQ
jgi:hypothetical protein